MLWWERRRKKPKIGDVVGDVVGVGAATGRCGAKKPSGQPRRLRRRPAGLGFPGRNILLNLWLYVFGSKTVWP
jgi:hypothetical protein